MIPSSHISQEFIVGKKVKSSNVKKGEMQMEQMNYELVLSTGKKVVLRQPSIKDQDLAGQMVAGKAGDNAMAFIMLVASEMVKMLLVSVNGKILSGIEKEQLDNFFDYQEYGELQLGVKEILGEVKKPQINLVKISGDK